MFAVLSPAGGLTAGIDPLAPIAIGVVVGLVFVAGLVVVRRRLSARESPGAAKTGTGSEPAVDAWSGRDRNLPRWLDPSVAAARYKTDRALIAGPAAAVAIAPARVPMAFVTPGDELTERQRVRYDGVPLLDRPDDVLGWLVRELDGGDEVEVLERAEIWAYVRTPTNLVGWVPSMTLAAVSAAAVDNGAHHTVATERDLPAAADEPIALEALLEIVAARRLARREPEPPVEAAPTSPRPRTRKPKAAASPSPTRRRRQGANAPQAEET